MDLYCKIIKILQKYGTVLTEHVGDPKLEKSGSGMSLRLAPATSLHVRGLILLNSYFQVKRGSQMSISITVIWNG